VPPMQLTGPPSVRDHRYLEIGVPPSRPGTVLLSNCMPRQRPGILFLAWSDSETSLEAASPHEGDQHPPSSRNATVSQGVWK